MIKSLIMKNDEDCEQMTTKDCLLREDTDCPKKRDQEVESVTHLH